MAVNKRRKNSRQRGSQTHGWGSMKKHRGAGNRGGTGNAGSGKRSDSKKPSFWKTRRKSGKYGFVNRGNPRPVRSINTLALERKLPDYLSRNFAKEENDGIAINLPETGHSKLISKGKVGKKMFITCDSASPKAIKEIESAGGSVTLLKEKEVEARDESPA